MIILTMWFSLQRICGSSGGGLLLLLLLSYISFSAVYPFLHSLEIVAMFSVCCFPYLSISCVCTCTHSHLYMFDFHEYVGNFPTCDLEIENCWRKLKVWAIDMSWLWLSFGNSLIECLCVYIQDEMERKPRCIMSNDFSLVVNLHRSQWWDFAQMNIHESIDWSTCFI